MLLALIAGVLFGYLGSIPAAGPLALLIVESAISGNTRRGIRLAIGGAIAESLYALGACLGVSTVLARHPLVIPAVRAFSGIAVIVLGVAMVRSMMRTKRAVALPSPEVQIDRGVALGFMLVALNPAFLVAWTAFVSLLESGSPFALTLTSRDAPVLALGAFVGIVGWFLTLLTMVSRNRERFSPDNLRRVSLGVALLLIAMGAWTLVEVVRVKIVAT